MSSHFSRAAFSAALWCALLAFTLPALCQVNVLTQHNDNQRTGANFNETTLTTANVNANTFGKLFSLPIDGFTYTQPLYVSGLTVAGGTRNVVYAATAHDSVYAFDADNGAPLWKMSLGTPIPAALHGGNIQIEIGIMGTPVIDLGSSALYVVSATYENSVEIFRLHALDLATGAEKFTGPVQISAQVNGMGDGNDGAGHVPFKASQQNQRPALTLVNGLVYITFSSHEDRSPYHGWVLAYDAATLQQVAVFNDTPNGGEGGIWMGGQGLTVDSANNLYMMTGNSKQSGESKADDYGESFLKLTQSGSALAVSDYFKANNYDSLNAGDVDLGSGGPVAIPGTTDIVGVGKQGLLYVVDTTNMGKLNAGKDQVVQEFQAGFGLFGAPVFWNSSTPTLYLWGRGDNLRAYPFANGLLATTPSALSVPTTPAGQDISGNPCGALSVSSNGSAPGTGIVWGAAPSADPEGQTVKGTLYAFDAANVAHELWDSRQIPNRDDYGNYAKWEPPTVANGKVYVPTNSGQICVYGLLPPVPPGPPANLTAKAGNGLAVLNWTAAPQGTDYNIKRAAQSGGPYATVATGVTALNYPDQGLTNGATYYYVVSGHNSFGESANSNEAAVTPSASAQGAILSLNFVGNDPNPMDGSESAGVVPALNWNNGTGGKNSLLSLQDNLGLPTTASATWSANNAWALGIADTPGNFRMMNGYLDTTNTSTVTVTVSALPSTFTSSGYDVYVYCNADGSTTRSGDYTIGSTTIHEQNMPPFSGTFTQANNSQGNYVKFTGLTGSSFTLTARPSATGGGQRSPVNAIQIVAHVPPPPPTGLTAAAGNGQVQLAWTAPAGPVLSYNVYRGTSAGQKGATPIATGVTTTSYTDTTVTNETKYFYQITALNGGGESQPSVEAGATPSADISLTPVIQINAGGGAVAPFAADTDFSGGAPNSTGAAIDTSTANSAPAAVYQTGRYGAFSYVIPGLSPGAHYTVGLHFAETYWNQSGKRIQNITVNGAPALTNFDIFAAAGAENKAVVKTVTTSADASGQITVSFLSAAGSPDGNALVAGLEALVPAVSAPTVAAAALATPNPVTGTTAGLSVLGADAGGEPNLTYTWSATGPAPVSFSVNGVNAAKNSVATFTQAGTYTLTATLANAQAKTVPSSVRVTVNPTPTALAVSPSLADVPLGHTQQFTAAGYDQFGSPLSPPPAVTWTAAGGVVSPTGLYRCSLPGGSYTITAAAAGLKANAQVYCPLAPPSLTATPGDSQVALIWAKPAGPVTTYTLTYGTAPGAENIVVANLTGTATTVPALTNGQAYYFVVSAANAGGVSLNSAEVSATPSPNPAPTQTALMPVADSYVWSGPAAGQNKGSETALRAFRAGNDGLSTGNQCAYLKFDLTGVTQAPSSAMLALTVDRTSYPVSRSATIQLNSVADSSWTELGLTWNNAPGLNRANFSSAGTLLGTQTVSLKAGTTGSYALTAFVSSHLGQMVTVQLINPNLDGLTCNFVSREGAAGKPALLLTY